MDTEFLKEILATQGFPAFLIIVAIGIWVFRWMPYIRERDKEAVAREEERERQRIEREDRRIEEDLKHRTALMKQMADDREASATALAEAERRHREDRTQMHTEHRQDMNNLMVIMDRFVDKIDKRLEHNTTEIVRVGGLVLDVGNKLGRPKGDMLEKASKATGVTLDPEMYKTRPGG